MRWFLEWQRFGIIFETPVDSAHEFFKELHAALKIEQCVRLADQSIIEIRHRLFLESDLGFELNANIFYIFIRHIDLLLPP
jgi:hypothetical protein